jgi:hypothetical protein
MFKLSVKVYTESESEMVSAASQANEVMRGTEAELKALVGTVDDNEWLAWPFGRGFQNAWVRQSEGMTTEYIIEPV